MQTEQSAHTSTLPFMVRCMSLQRTSLRSMCRRNVAAAAVASLALVIGSAGAAFAEPVEDTVGEPPNVGDTKTAAIEYHDSGQYQHDLADVAAQAIACAATSVLE